MKIKFYILIIITILISSQTLFSLENDFKEGLATLKNLPVLNRGRIKSFDTHARETMRFISGKDKINGKEPIFTFLKAVSNQKNSLKIIKIRYLPLQKFLMDAKKVDMKNESFSIDELIDVYGLEKKIKNKITLMSSDPTIFKSALELMEQVNIVKNIGEKFLIVPPSLLEKTDNENLKLPKLFSTWITPISNKKIIGNLEYQKKFKEIKITFAKVINSLLDNKPKEFNSSVKVLKSKLISVNSEIYNRYLNRLNMEVKYNSWKPFSITFIAYLLVNWKIDG
jgi:hypothetical protein